MQSYLEKNVIFFGGKGGVGKTTSASAFALGASRRGKNTLLVSTDPAHNIGDMFGTAVGNEETRIEKRLYAVEIDPEKETDRYIRG